MNKRLITALLAIVLALMISIPAMADETREDWDARCNWAITQDAALYSASLREDATATEPYDFSPVGTLPAGTKVSIRSSVQGMREVSYWNDGICTGWVEEASVVWSSSSSASQEAAAPSDAWSALEVTLSLDEGENIPVTLQTLGTAQSIVHDGQKMLTVNTADLSWETQAEDHQRLGIIHAPSTGKATLRASASSSARKLGDCEDGRIVVVLKVGATWTRILYDGQEGCVLTAAVTLHSAVPEEDFSSATLTYKGRTDASAAISVYTATNGKRRIDQWRAGKAVVVLGETGSWAEIEIDGWRGFVKSAYLE